MKKLIFVLLAVATSASAQIAAPQINLSGNIGAQGFPVLNSGTLIFSTDANHTMTAQESSATGGIKITSGVTLTATRNLVLPTAYGKLQFVSIENATTGGQSIVVIGQSGTGITIPNGQIATGVWFDGTNVTGTLSGGPPTGAAGGSLNGTYPNPGIAATGVTAGSYTDINATVNAAGQLTAIATDTTAAHGPGSGATIGHSVVEGNTQGTSMVDGGAQPINLLAYGAKCNGVFTYDGAISASSSALASTTATFTAGDVGKAIEVDGAAATGGNLITTIATFTDAHHVGLTASASTTVSGANVVYGTDDTADVQAAVNAAGSGVGGGQITTPPGTCILAGALNTSQNGNSLIAIPFVAGGTPGPMESISIVGTTVSTSYPEIGISVTPPTAGTVFYGMTPGSGTSPSILGGPTPYQYFTVSTVSLRNLIFRTPPNPTLSAVNFQNVANALIYQVTADVNVNNLTPGVPAPTHTGTYGFYLPTLGNFGMVDVEESYVTGYYGCFDISEHANLFSDFGQQCHYGVEFDAGNHFATLTNVLLQWNAVQLYGNPANGGYLNVEGNVDLEDNGSLTTYDFDAPDLTGKLDLRLVGALTSGEPSNVSPTPVINDSVQPGMILNVVTSGWTNGTGNFAGGLASATQSTGPPNSLIVSGNGGPTSPNGVYDYQGMLNGRPWYRMIANNTVFYVYYGTGNPSGVWCVANSITNAVYDTYCDQVISGGIQWQSPNTAPTPPNGPMGPDTGNGGIATGTVNIQGGNNYAVNASGAQSQGWVRADTVVVTGSGSLSPNATYTYAGTRPDGIILNSPYYTATISSTTWYLFRQGESWCIGRVLPSPGNCALSSTGDYWNGTPSSYGNLLPPSNSSWNAEGGFTGAVTSAYYTGGYFAHQVDANGNDTAATYNGVALTATGSTALCLSQGGTYVSCVAPVYNYYWSIQPVLFSTSTALGPVYFLPNGATWPSSTFIMIARLSGTISCTVAPSIVFLDLGTSATTAYGSATVFATLTTGTSDGVYTNGGGAASIAAGHYVGMGFSGGTCVTAPTIDLTVTL